MLLFFFFKWFILVLFVKNHLSYIKSFVSSVSYLIIYQTLYHWYNHINYSYIFNRFPKEQFKRNEWLSILQLSITTKFWHRVCSINFKPNDYIFSNMRKILKSTALPFKQYVLYIYFLMFAYHLFFLVTRKYFMCHSCNHCRNHVPQKH